MSGSLREILPRQELRKFDRLPGAYPTVARTGDSSRKGNNNVFFDDLNTIVFSQSGSFVNYPTTLRTSSKLLLNDMTSSITSSKGGTNRNAIENWITIPAQQETFKPFVESKLSEQNLNKTGSFFLTGTDITVAGIGFSSPISSKTMIRLSIPVIKEVQMGTTAASVFYFNNSLGRFEEVATSRKLSGTPGQYPMNDVMLFDQFGGNTFGNFTSISFWTNSNYNIGSVLPAILSLSPSDMPIPSALADSAFAPTSSHYISMSNYINKPFLLEKAVIDVPMKFGAGWFNDRTQYKSVSNSTSNWYDDGGGPCVTFSLQNVFPDRRDLILSATVIPSGDNIISYQTQSISDLGNEAGGGTIYLRSTLGFKTTGTPSCVITPGTDNTFTGSAKMSVEPAISNGVITHKNFLTSIAQNSTLGNSFVTLANVLGRSSYPIQPSGRSYFGREYAAPNNTNVLPIVKTNFGNPTAPVYDYPDAYFYQNGAISPYTLFPNDKIILCASKYRPISVNNGSNVFSPSLSHDVVLATGSIFITLYGSLVANEQEFHDTLNQRLETNEVHEIIGADPVLDSYNVEYFQTFSGSYVSEQLTGSIILPTSTRGVYTGSNRYVWADAANTSSFQQNLLITETSQTFSIPNLNGGTLTAGDFPANYSDLNTFKKEKFGITRFMSTVSANERYYDSLVPAIDEVMSIDNAYLVGLTYVYQPCSAHPTPIGAPVVGVTFDVYTSDPAYAYDTIQLSSDVDWTKSYPFESKYSSLVRRVDAGNVFYKKSLTYGCGFGSIGTPTPAAPNTPPILAQKVLVNGGSFWRWGGDASNFFSYYSLTLRHDTVTKLLYGFGDLNTYPNDAMLASYGANCYPGGSGPALGATNKLFGCTNFPSPREMLNYNGINDVSATIGSPCQANNPWHGAVIRGWKYGIINAFPQFSKAIFRYNRFGQPRDMLEQRQDSKFYESAGYKFDGSTGGNTGPLLSPVQVKFVNQKGEITKPEYTFSSNLSVECTSSLPYFDGIVRNREEPINVSSLGLTVVT